jgi:hypothetical protein
MSSGSRATQAKPEALPSCSEKKLSPLFAGLQMCLQARISFGKSSFCASESQAQCGFAMSAAIEVDRLARIDLQERAIELARPIERPCGEK